MKSLIRATASWVLAILLILNAGSLAADTQKKLYTGPPAKYVFLFIGDGLGIPQRTAAGKYLNKKLLMDSLPAQGLTTTHAANRFITGSAAAATSLATGLKTNVGMIGMAPDQRWVKSTAKMAKERGMKVGMVSSVSIDHATPAAFYAHVPARSQYYDIAIALGDSGFDYFGGGGLKDPDNKKQNTRNFKGSAIDYIKGKGYRIVATKAAFTALKKGDEKIFAVNPRLPDGKALPYSLDMTDRDISLAEFTAKGIELLDNPNGFFLMVEAGKLDWACHANDAVSAIHGTLAYDKAVSVAVEFAKKHPKETLIVVTGDHECGGLTLGFAGTKYSTNLRILGKQVTSFHKFSVEVLKPYKAQCKGKCRFDDVKPIIEKHFGLKFTGDPGKDPLVVEPYQEELLRQAYFRSMLGTQITSKDPKDDLHYGGYEPLTVTITHILNNKAGLGWTSFMHTGVPVATSAMGVGAEIFNGYYDNTDVALKMMSIMGIDPKVHFFPKKDTKQAASH